jgi:hypothetical protein
VGCGLASGSRILEAIIGDRLKAADVALNSGGEATIIRSETQDGCCVARAPWAERLAHLAFLSLSKRRQQRRV